MVLSAGVRPGGVRSMPKMVSLSSSPSLPAGRIQPRKCTSLATEPPRPPPPTANRSRRSPRRSSGNGSARSLTRSVISTRPAGTMPAMERGSPLVGAKSAATRVAPAGFCRESALPTAAAALAMAPLGTLDSATRFSSRSSRATTSPSPRSEVATQTVRRSPIRRSIWR